MRTDRNNNPMRNFPADLALSSGLPIAAVAIVCGRFLGLILGVTKGDLFLFWVAMFLAVMGLTLLFFACLPLYKKHLFFTFGSKLLDQRHKRTYRLAYLFAAGAIFLLAMQLLVVS